MIGMGLTSYPRHRLHQTHSLIATIMCAMGQGDCFNVDSAHCATPFSIGTSGSSAQCVG